MAEGVNVGRGYVQIVPSAEGIKGSITTALSGEAESAGKKSGSVIGTNLLGTLKTSVAAAGASVGALLTAGIGASTALVSNVGKIAEYGDNIDKMSQKMGLSIESYQEWDAVMQHSGTSMETMKASMKTLANAAESGSEAFDLLGISQEQIKSMNQEQLFEATIAALQNVEDETTRTYLAGKTLGRGATELGALLNTSAEDTQAMRDRVRELGGVMSTDAVKAAAAYQDSLQDMQTAFSGLSRGIIQEFLPSVTEIMNGLTEIFNGNSDEGIGMITSGIDNMLAGINESLPRIAEIAGSIVTAASQALIANLPQIASAGLSIIGTLIGTIFEQLPTLISSVMAAAQSIVSTVVGFAPQAMTAISTAVFGYDIFTDMATFTNAIMKFLGDTVPTLIEQGLAWIEGFADGMLNGTGDSLSSLGSILDAILQGLAAALPRILTAGLKLVGALASGLIKNIPSIVSSIGTVAARLLATIAGYAPQMLSKGLELLGKLASGLIQGIPRAIAAIPQLFRQFASGFAGYDWGSMGINIIEGIKNGILGAAGRIADAARNAASAAFNAAKSFLGIRSPSRLFRDQIGKNMALGMAEGFEENSPEVDVVRTVRSTADAAAKAASVEPVQGRAAGGAYTIEIPLVVDGRVAAKATAEFMLDELGRLTARRSRMEGIATV